jgi:hypothetical protein
MDYYIGLSYIIRLILFVENIKGLQFYDIKHDKRIDTIFFKNKTLLFMEKIKTVNDD